MNNFFAEGFFSSFLLSNTTMSFEHHASVFLINLVSYAYIIVKFYKVLCYSKLTFEWLPMINPYVWPFSFFFLITKPYFDLWETILPIIKFNKSSLEVSSIIGLEALNAVLYFCVRFFEFLALTLEKIESIQ